MPEIIKEILTLYWSQTVLIIAALGYLIKRAYDLRSKKVEQKHSLFQQNRINVIMKFIDSYIELEEKYKLIPEGRLNLKQLSAVEFEELFLKKYSNLYSSYFYLKFYLEPLELARYGDIVTYMRNISSKISDFYKKTEMESNLEVVQELNTSISDTVKINNENFKVIANLFREYSDKHFVLK